MQMCYDYDKQECIMNKFIASIIILIAVMSCKGGGGGAADAGSGGTGTTTSSGVYGTGTTISGLLTDAPMSGINYRSTSYSGTTTSTGGYICKDGEEVDFYLGSLTFGRLMCRSVTTPVELISNGSKTYEDAGSLTSDLNTKLNRLLVVFQMMDDDQNTSNGIAIDSSVATSFLSEFDNLSSTTAHGLDEVLNDSSLFNTWKSNTIVNVQSGYNYSYYYYSPEPTETEARTHFNSTVSAITPCSTSDVPYSTSVTGVNSKCTATGCQSGYRLSTQGLCEKIVTCSDVKRVGVASFSGTYPDCVATTCENGYDLDPNGYGCLNQNRNDYYCIRGTLQKGAISADLLNEFPGVDTTTLLKNSLKYNFANLTTGEAKNRTYQGVSALFILRMSLTGSELRKKTGSTVVSIPVGLWGMDQDQPIFTVRSIQYSNPARLEGNPQKTGWFHWSMPSVNPDLDSLASANTTIQANKEQHGVLTGSSVSASAINWTIEKNCSLTGWTVNY